MSKKWIERNRLISYDETVDYIEGLIKISTSLLEIKGGGDLLAPTFWVIKACEKVS